jgi:hypothetical protein
MPRIGERFTAEYANDAEKKLALLSRFSPGKEFVLLPIPRRFTFLLLVGATY